MRQDSPCAASLAIAGWALASASRLGAAVRHNVAGALVVVGPGANATNALIISQVVLSIAPPPRMIALLLLTRRSDIMGRLANGRLTNAAATAAPRWCCCSNLFLILQTLGVPIPGLADAG